MKNVWQQLLNDETGVIISSELALVGTVGVLGMAVGLEAVSTAVNQELNDLSSAFGSLNQSYSLRSLSKAGHGRVSGSCFTNQVRGNAGLNLSEICGQGGGVNSNQMLIGSNAQGLVGASVPVLGGQVIENQVIEEVLEERCPVKTEEIVCPEDEIIEEHVIRRRVKANGAATLNDDCARNSQINVIKKGSNPEIRLNSIPVQRSAPEKIEIKPKKRN